MDICTSSSSNTRPSRLVGPSIGYKGGNTDNRWINSRTSDDIVHQAPNPISPSRELGPVPARVYINGGLIETVSRATSIIGPEPIVPVPDGASAESASVLAARESEHRPPRPTPRKRWRGDRARFGATQERCYAPSSVSRRKSLKAPRSHRASRVSRSRHRHSRQHPGVGLCLCLRSPVGPLGGRKNSRNAWMRARQSASPDRAALDLGPIRCAEKISALAWASCQLFARLSA